MLSGLRDMEDGAELLTFVSSFVAVPPRTTSSREKAVSRATF